MVDRPPQPAEDDTNAQQHRRLVWSLVGAGLLVLCLLLACVLWIPKWLYPPLTDNDLSDVKTAQNELDIARVQELKDARLKLQNDARTTLLQGAGALLLLIGAATGATVTLRQVKVSQDGLHATREQMQHTLETTRQQLNLTEQGQVTDRYTRAVEQLGHEKAPVRLGALYSLEHLAQDNPQYRQTVVDVVCAYLRMPFIPPGQTELDAEQVQEKAPSGNGRDRVLYPGPGGDPVREELQVRQTAQRLLANHLRCPPQVSGQEAQLLPPSPQQAFWPGISLDLTGATLVDFTLTGTIDVRWTFPQTSVMEAVFVGATFWGDAGFDGATFQGDTRFDGATFRGDAWFRRAIFRGDAGFDRGTFRGNTWFGEATFQGHTRFGVATFQGMTMFNVATFQGHTWFERATFQGNAFFGSTTFQNHATFTNATFQGNLFGGAIFKNVAEFDEAIFQGNAGFDGASFQRSTGWDGATFKGDAGFRTAIFQFDAQFDKATFKGNVRFDGAQVLHFDDDPGRDRAWPEGWTVRPHPGNPRVGQLVREEQTK